MNPRPKRPPGVTLLAIVFLWIGCLGALIFPIVAATGITTHLAEMVATGHRHEGLLHVGVDIGVLIWWLLYIFYAFVGFGLWKLQDWARRCVLGITIFSIAVGVVIVAIWVRPFALGLPMVVGFAGAFGWQIWYVRLDRIRFAFGAKPTLRELTPAAGRHAKYSGKRKAIWIASSAFAILCLFVGALVYAVESMFRQSGIYKLALSEAQHSSCVAGKIGVPFAPGHGISGSLEESDNGDADISIPVHGPKGEGHLVVLGKKHSGLWVITSLTLVRGDVQDKIIPVSSASCEASAGQ